MLIVFMFLVVFSSSLENENRLLERELLQMKSAAATYDKKTSQMKQELAEYIKKYGEKSQKCAALVKEIEHLRARDDNYEKENKRLQQELVAMVNFQKRLCFLPAYCDINTLEWIFFRLKTAMTPVSC